MFVFLCGADALQRKTELNVHIPRQVVARHLATVFREDGPVGLQPTRLDYSYKTQPKTRF